MPIVPYDNFIICMPMHGSSETFYECCVSIAEKMSVWGQAQCKVPQWPSPSNCSPATAIHQKTQFSWWKPCRHLKTTFISRPVEGRNYWVGHGAMQPWSELAEFFFVSDAQLHTLASIIMQACYSVVSLDRSFKFFLHLCNCHESLDINHIMDS